MIHLCICPDKTIEGKLPSASVLYVATLQNGYMKQFPGNQIAYVSERTWYKNATDNDNFSGETGLQW
jgi:hypothetical protein